MKVEVIPKRIKFNKMANKQPLFEHEGGSLTDSSNEIELKIHEAFCKNEQMSGKASSLETENLEVFNIPEIE